ncbi:MAG: YceI family protein [Chitinophagaceae bacterium]
MKRIYSTILISMLALCTHAQTYMTRNGEIRFFSKTPLEDIKADNKQVYTAIDLTKKTIAFTLLLKGFLFEKQLMQDHFNENYVESDKYPKAIFTGTIDGNVSASPGTYNVQVKGQLTLHGVTKELTAPATLEITAGKLNGKSSFLITPSDYNIQIPSLVRDKIAKQIAVQVLAECTPVK